MLVNPQKAFIGIGEEFADDLHRKSLFIFAIHDIVTFIAGFEVGKDLGVVIGGTGGFLFDILTLVISVSISVMLSVILSLSIYWLSRKLKGKSDYLNIESTLAHSYIPLTIGLAVILILKIGDKFRL